MASLSPAEWVASTTGSGNAVTATKAAPTQPAVEEPRALVVFGVDLSFGTALAAGTTLIINDGTTALWEAQIPVTAGVYQRQFPRGLRCTPGNSASAVVAATGTVTVSVNLDGVIA